MMQKENNALSSSSKKRKVRNDLILVVVILITALFAYLIYALCRPGGAEIVVTVNGEPFGRYALSEDVEVVIDSTANKNGRNVLVIHDGVAYISEASCPDLICANHRPISKVGDTIVCLPNRVVITVE